MDCQRLREIFRDSTGIRRVEKARLGITLLLLYEAFELVSLVHAQAQLGLRLLAHYEAIH
jgi:hypothetical protein